MSLEDLPPLSDVIRRLGLSARKSLGQNFILDLNLTRRIARAAGPLEGKTIVEIGPGPGGLTRALLLEGAAKVIVIERDERCLPALEEIADCCPKQIEIIHGDAMEVDYAQLNGGQMQIAANLPYNVATTLLITWLKSTPWPPWYEKMSLMFQKEVGERIIASPGSKAYGRLSVLTAWRTKARILFNLSARAFTPSPKVDSTLVELIPHAQPSADCRVEALECVTAAAFGQRRKMLRQSLKQLVPDPLSLLEKADLDPSLRAENVDVAGFCRLARLISDH